MNFFRFFMILYDLKSKFSKFNGKFRLKNLSQPAQALKSSCFVNNPITIERTLNFKSLLSDKAKQNHIIKTHISSYISRKIHYLIYFHIQAFIINKTTKNSTQQNQV